MKTPEEIKKGLIWCIKEDFCKGCPYEDDCYVSLSLKNIPMVKEALAYIQQLESELEAVKRERDAAVKDIQYVFSEPENPLSDCMVCKHKYRPICESCEWEWRGVCLENTEVQDENT